MSHSRLNIVAGPNGSGKSTIAELLLREKKIENFINADTIARGLNASTPDLVSIDAGRLMLEMIHERIAEQESFSFESTLSGLIWKKLILSARKQSFTVRIYFVLVESADTAVLRVSERVKNGGHSVPEETIRRRFRRSLKMFDTVYRNLADRWWVFDNSSEEAEVIASRTNGEPQISDRYRTLFQPEGRE